MYQALYRKWRPTTFDDVVGQEHITEILKKQIATGSYSHAYLFTGARGTGKTTCAKILAKALNCENPINGNPCCKCPSCIGIANGSILDIEELDAASNNGVDDIRNLRDEAMYSPRDARKRVYILDEVHMLTNAASNALLKILEEPPEHLVFILATTELHKVLPTVLSRCQRYAFKRIPTDKIAGRLKYVAGEENIDMTDRAANLLARLSDGALRDALSLMDQCLIGKAIDVPQILESVGMASSLDIVNILSYVGNKDTIHSLELLNSMYANGRDMSVILNEINTLQRDLLINLLTGSSGDGLLSGSYDIQYINTLAKLYTPERLTRGIDIVSKCIYDLKNLGSKISAELCIVRLCDPSLGDDTSSFGPRIAEIEKQLRDGVKIQTVTPTVSDLPASQPVVNSAGSDNVLPAVHTECKPVLVNDPIAEVCTTEPTDSMPLVEEISNEGVSPQDNSDWKNFVSYLCQKDSGYLTRCLNTDNIRGVFEDNKLNIYTPNGFVIGLLSDSDTKESIRQIASEYVGKPIIVSVFQEDITEENGGPQRLEELKKFSNVTFL